MYTFRKTVLFSDPDGLFDVSEQQEGTGRGASRRRVAAVVGLTLLQVIRDQDLPGEVLESEDPSVTMPRRLGLSEVVERQIRQYREAVRRRRRISDVEVRDLVRLVIRRPDAEEVFFKAGRRLAGGGGAPGWRRFLPRTLVFALARRRVETRLKRLFGRRIGGFGRGPFTMEGRALIFFQSDPGGDACHFLSGFCESVLQRYAGREARVVHSRCQARQDEICRWTILAEEAVSEAESVRDFALNPEPS